MTAKLIVGPLLGVESDTHYTVCFLTDTRVKAATVSFNAKAVSAKVVAQTPKGLFWRAETTLAIPKKTGQFVSYTVQLDEQRSQDQHQRDRWTFYVPSADEKPLMAYTSCNGFSSADILTKTEKPYALWEQMMRQHLQQPYSLLMMGGDQLYADEIWSAVAELHKWSLLEQTQRIARKFTATMRDQVDRFYEKLYSERWQNPAMSLTLASIPTVMMWDDHDIFDGWGSYPIPIQTSEIYQGIYQIAKQYFELFQIRGKANRSLLDANAEHYGFAFQFRQYHLLALDNRAERTLTQVMSQNQWTAVNRYLDKHATTDDLLVLSAVPVVYRDFSFTEASFDATPWEEELTDDLKDHWRAKEHQGERARLIMRLLNNARSRSTATTGKTVILSGDVHLGCLGVIHDSRQSQHIKVHQIVSSGVVHPSPSRIAWMGIMAVTNDKDEFLNEDETIKISMLKPFGSDKYIRSRNFVTLKEGTDAKLWVNWICEHNQSQPSYPLE